MHYIVVYLCIRHLFVETTPSSNRTQQIFLCTEHPYIQSDFPVITLTPILYFDNAFF